MMVRPAKQTAVLLMNYGGPERAEDCEEYIRNIFLDPDLIPIPNFIRPMVARFVGRRRAPSLQKNYEAMGRYSPILDQTTDQAKALEAALGEGFTCFVGMRYWRPFIEEACCAVRTGGFDRVVLLPLYPQESRSTSGSSINEARRCLRDVGFGGEVAEVRSFWEEPGYLEALTEGVRSAVDASPPGTRVLFSAHGLPLSVARKDNYPGHIAATVAEVASRLDIALDPMTPIGTASGLFPRSSPLLSPPPCRGVLAWQSKVGPAKWLEPSVEHALEAWAKEGVRDVVLVPVAFVSEHSETLYELDVLYGGMARDLGMSVRRVPTVQTHPRFIEALAAKVRTPKGLP
jgi:protoporphyrin/coproporphyrin ferrochelatase